jgi:hypothetical protein
MFCLKGASIIKGGLECPAIWKEMGGGAQKTGLFLLPDHLLCIQKAGQYQSAEQFARNCERKGTEMLKVVKFGVALALGLILSLSLLTSGSFVHAQSVNQSATQHATQMAVTTEAMQRANAVLPNSNVQLTSLKSAAFGPRFGGFRGGFGGFRGGFGGFRGGFFRGGFRGGFGFHRHFFFHRRFFRRPFFFGGVGGWGGCW